MRGIYKIENTENGKFYIGSSKNIFHRWQTHMNELRMGLHLNNNLQKDYYIFGATCFEFSLLELVLDGDKELLGIEQSYIDQYLDSEKLYNVMLDVNDSALINNDEKIIFIV